MKTLFCTICAFLSLWICLSAQNENFDNNNDEADSLQINLYDDFNPIMGGDSVRMCGKSKCNGNIIDRYENGSIKHKGFYTKGKLLDGYENYFSDGRIERKFTAISPDRGKLTVYFPDGIVRTEAEFYKKEAVLWKDYYSDGRLEYWEEYEKHFKYLLKMNFYFENGMPESLLELTDKKKKIYSASEYYENGNLKEKGNKIHVPENGGYVKEGAWELYDEKGNLSGREFYNKGNQVEE